MNAELLQYLAYQRSETLYEYVKNSTIKKLKTRKKQEPYLRYKLHRATKSVISEYYLQQFLNSYQSVIEIQYNRKSGKRDIDVYFPQLNLIVDDKSYTSEFLQNSKHHAHYFHFFTLKYSTYQHLENYRINDDSYMLCPVDWRDTSHPYWDINNWNYNSEGFCHSSDVKNYESGKDMPRMNLLTNRNFHNILRERLKTYKIKQAELEQLQAEYNEYCANYFKYKQHEYSK